MMVFPSERGETPGGSDVTVSGHKQKNWKVQTGLQLWPGMVQCYPLITTMSSLTIIWPLHDLGHHHLSPTEQMICPTLLQRVWEWDGTFGTKAVPDEADLVLYLCSRFRLWPSSQQAEPRPNIPQLSVLPEWNTTVEQRDLPAMITTWIDSNARESPTLWQLCTILRNVRVEGHSSSQLTFTRMPTLHLHDNKSV